MDAILFAVSFEVVLLQMRILEKSAEVRLKNWEPSNKVEQLQRDKLVLDRTIALQTIRRTLLEVAENGTWTALTKSLELLERKCCDVESLKQTNKELKTSLEAVLAELVEKRNYWASQLHQADEKVAFLRDKMADDVANANTRLLYADKWLFARFESLELKHKVPREPPPRPDHDKRVHAELLKAYAMQIKEHEDSLEYWRKRYIVDIADIAVRVQQKCEQLRIACEKRKGLQALYDLHEGEMRGWLNFKRERAARLAREEHARLSATRIQSWWRGIMVRKALGQFKFLRTLKKSSSKGKKK